MWADVKKHNMSNIVVRNGGGWKPSLLNDANIVHAVKKCYKLKIDSRDLKSRFYDVIRACHHIFKQKSLRCIANVVLLEANGTTIAMQRRLK